VAPPTVEEIIPAGEEPQVRCPHCGSTQVHAERRGWSWWVGFLGSGKIYITCLLCGKRFLPGKWQVTDAPQSYQGPPNKAAEDNTLPILLAIGVVAFIILLILLAANA